MEIVKDTPFEAGWLVWQARPPEPTLTVVVKGTFDLVPGGPCPISAEQALLTGDEHHHDDIERSVRYDSDLAPLKPNGEHLLLGTFRAPGNRLVAHVTTTLQVGRSIKQIALVGDRFWKDSIAGGVTDPIPFVSMPLCWERSFGGPGVAANPVGRGIAPVKVDAYDVVPLPNIEDPRALVRTRLDRPAPAGTFPVPRTWAARTALTGTYDRRWRETRWPWYPEDFDFRHFNAAPPDQQIRGYFRGDEELLLINVHPDCPELSARLPALRPRCFLSPSERRVGLRELAMNLDTVVVDAGALRLYCVWRGLAGVANESLADVGHLFVTHDALQARSSAGRASAGPDSRAGRAGAAPESGADPERRFEACLAAAAAEDAAFEAEVPPAPTAPPPMRAPSPERARAMRERVERALAEGASCARWKLPGADLGGMDLRGGDFTGAILTGADLRGAVLDRARLDGAVLQGADLTGASLCDASLAGADLTGARGADARFERAVLDDATGPEATLRGARFLHASLRRADVSGADLTGARFEDAALDEADLSGARLDDAVFVRCSLVDAWLEGGVSAQRVAMDGCDLTLLRASEGGDFTGASFRRARAGGARFGQAKLGRADFSSAELERADFSEAHLVEARLSGCRLKQACFAGAALVGASLGGSDLYEARLEAADLRHADLRSASLFRAELWKANLAGARLEGADLTGTKLA